MAPAPSSTDNSTNSSAFLDEPPIPPVDESHEDSDSHLDHSTTSFKSSTKNGGADNSSEESSSLAKAETRAVNRTKLLVLLVLFAAASAVGVATYLYAANTEQKQFEEKVRSCLRTCVRLLCDGQVSPEQDLPS